MAYKSLKAAQKEWRDDPNVVQEYELRDHPHAHLELIELPESGRKMLVRYFTIGEWWHVSVDFEESGY